MNEMIFGLSAKQLLAGAVYLMFPVIMFLYLLFPVLINIVFIAIFYLVVANGLKKQKITLKQALFRLSAFAITEPPVTVIVYYIWFTIAMTKKFETQNFIQSLTKDPLPLYVLVLCFAFNLLFVSLAALRFKYLTRRALESGQLT
ncbi:MAG: hypothetical protein LBJ59_04685 [Zoogloeaceae bacterium]|jgi:hypothetical protein|nr:hypothetical protein [Zoogloeaceae bacterium]